MNSRQRCEWCGSEPRYVAYHDNEWGVPERDDRALFEKLILDGFQAGLSWWIILKKREDFRRAFAGFEPEQVARFDEHRVAALLADASIVRNRAKIEATVGNARAYLQIQSSGLSFSDYLWEFVDGQPLQNAWNSTDDVPAETPLSRRLSKDLKARGFRFCGPTIVYAFMEATGMVNDHLTRCFRHQEVAQVGSSF